jgi:hypothetical protein
MPNPHDKPQPHQKYVQRVLIWVQETMTPGSSLAKLDLILKGIKLVLERERIIMADLSGINSALEDLSAQITQLADQVANLEAGTVTQAELDTVEQGIRNAAASVDAIIEPDEGEEPEPEPVP